MKELKPLHVGYFLSSSVDQIKTDQSRKTPHVRVEARRRSRVLRHQKKNERSHVQ